MKFPTRFPEAYCLPGGCDYGPLRSVLAMINRRSILWVCGLFGFASHPTPGLGQEISAGIGGMRTPDSPQSSYTWQLEYREEFSSRWAWSLAWINEGHIIGHHRDGVAAQLWRRWPLQRGRYSVDLGAGGYHLFDTQALPDNSDSRIAREWAPIGSLSFTHFAGRRWFWRLTANMIAPPEGITANTLALSLGYRAWRESPGEVMGTISSEQVRTTGHELTAFAGKTVVNATVGARAFARSFEYRYGVARHVDVSAAWLNEGDASSVRREGAAVQIWLVDALFNDRLTLGLGVGAYYNIRALPDERATREWAGMVSPTVSWRFSERWLARLIWHRVMCHYHRDTDVFLLGLGRRW